MAFYNPVSRARPWQLDRALDIVREYRLRTTRVVLGRDIGRPGESLITTTLEQLRSDQVDMRTMVIVGSSTTRGFPRDAHSEWVYTPRWYELGEHGSGGTVIRVPRLRERRAPPEPHRLVLEIDDDDAVRIATGRDGASGLRPSVSNQSQRSCAGLLRAARASTFAAERTPSASGVPPPPPMGASQRSFHQCAAPGSPPHLRLPAAEAHERNFRALAIRPIEQRDQQSLREREPLARQHRAGAIEHETMQRRALALLAMKAQVPRFELRVTFGAQGRHPVDRTARAAFARIRKSTRQ